MYLLYNWLINLSMLNLEILDKSFNFLQYLWHIYMTYSTAHLHYGPGEYKMWEQEKQENS